MEKFSVSLSHHEINLIDICLSSCAANCMYNGNSELAVEYMKLRDKLGCIVATKFLNK